MKIQKFQAVLNEEAEFIDVLTRISELKILKGEVERRHNGLETAQNRTSDRATTENTAAAHVNPIATIWSQPSPQGPIRPPNLEVMSFDGDILRWREFWDQFEAAIHNVKFSKIDKMNHLRSHLTGVAISYYFTPLTAKWQPFC